MFYRRKVVLLIIVTQTVLALCDSQKRLDKSCENGVCYREQDQGPCKPDNDEPRLFRWDAVQVYFSFMYFCHIFTMYSNEVSIEITS